MKLEKKRNRVYIFPYVLGNMSNDGLALRGMIISSLLPIWEEIRRVAKKRIESKI